MNNPSGTMFIHPDSLAATLDSINAALFERKAIQDQARSETAAWIADRQGLPGSYAGMFAPTEKDYAHGTLTFSGEPVRSSAGMGHLLSEEACRVLYLLRPSNNEVLESLKRARKGIFNRMDQSEIEGQWAGVYCCGTCSVSLWRHLSASFASGEREDLRRLENGLAALKRGRDGKGRWQRFPFFYTLLTLTDMAPELVRDEILYASPVIDRALRRAIKKDPEETTLHELRRRRIMERALELC